MKIIVDNESIDNLKEIVEGLLNIMVDEGMNATRKLEGIELGTDALSEWVENTQNMLDVIRSSGIDWDSSEVEHGEN